MATSVYLYIPNLIGYFRIILLFVAFGVAFDRPEWFLICYFLSFACDELDGRFARMFNQTSAFGAVLDMVTDRLATTALLVLLSQFYRHYFHLYLGLVALDIGSHWLQMHSSHLAAQKSHKDQTGNRSWLMRTYYTNRIFMGACCISCEVLYLACYARKFPDVPLLSTQIPVPELGAISVAELLALLAVPGFLVKQFTNIVQIKSASDTCIRCDPQRKNP
eukprot:jgi/Mesvir1/23563/Mv18259-RA.1